MKEKGSLTLSLSLSLFSLPKQKKRPFNAGQEVDPPGV